jgi:hypothetical protein
MHNEFKMCTIFCKIIQLSVTFTFEISTDWCSVMMARIGSKRATEGVDLQNTYIRGWLKNFMLFNYCLLTLLFWAVTAWNLTEILGAYYEVCGTGFYDVWICDFYTSAHNATSLKRVGLHFKTRSGKEEGFKTKFHYGSIKAFQ